MKKQWIIAIVAVIVVLVSAKCLSTAPIVDDEEDLSLIASGTIRATEVRVASEFGGRIQSVLVEVGDQVETGNALIKMDATPWLLQLAPAEAAIAVAQADLDVLLAGSRPEEIEAAEANLALSEAKRDGMQVAWENAASVVDDPQELDAQIIEARLQVKLAAQGVERAEAELARQQLLRDQQPEGTVKRRAADLQVQAAEQALAAAQSDERTAQTLLNRLWQIRNAPLGYIAQANAAKGQYHVAEQTVAVSKAQLGDLMDGPTPEEVAVARAKVHQAEAEANVLRVKVEHSTLTSPIDGYVIEQSVRAGELTAPAVAILTLADLSHVILEVYVPENRIGHVFTGQTVYVTVDSFPDEVFEGHVARIGEEPEFTPRNVATAEERLNTFYAVELRLPNPDILLKPGMSADATFEMEMLGEALAKMPSD